MGLPITGCEVLVVLELIPSGPLHIMFTVTGTSIALLNSTVQVRVTLAVPIGRMGLVGTLVMLMDTGAGTVWCIILLELEAIIIIIIEPMYDS